MKTPKQRVFWMFQFTLVFTAIISYAHFCDEGSLSHTCIISTIKPVTDDIYGDHTILIDKQGALLCTTLFCKIKIEVPTLIVYGSINGSDIEVHAPSLLHIAKKGVISADAGGYICEQGPGRGSGRLGFGGSGGGHGGYGSSSCYEAYAESSGLTYGDPTHPNDFGSGGGIGSGAQGGSGGGYVKIKAGTIILNGTISCNGGDATAKQDLSSGGGGGSGGSLIVQSRSAIIGSGSISANGGKGASAIHGGGGGGGGRILLNFTRIDDSITISVTAGTGGCEDGEGQDGTIFRPCPDGLYSPGGKAPCAPCTSGQIMQNNICKTCPYGTMYITVFQVCVPNLYIVIIPAFTISVCCFLCIALMQFLRVCCREASMICCGGSASASSTASERAPILRSNTSNSVANRIVKPEAKIVNIQASLTTLEPQEEALLCDICFVHRKDTALNCGHVMCEHCSENLLKCPYCKADITSVMKVYL